MQLFQLTLQVFHVSWILVEGLVYVVMAVGFKFRVCCLKWLALAEHNPWKKWKLKHINLPLDSLSRTLKISRVVSGGSWLRRKNGTRMIGPQPLIFGHAAQFITVNDYRFHPSVNGWLERGLVRPWGGMIGELEVGDQFTPFPFLRPRYIGVNGLHPLANS
ncbi:hypothetical protein KPL70_023782 [Citrus sinensis]|nr:hypothetical protein KPL70_023782 [Citrus sinensis]